jgi:hypothetical protein
MLKFFLLIFFLTGVKGFSQDPTWLWAKNAASTNNDFGNSVKVDAFGNVYVCGTFLSPSINFGNYTLNLGSDYERAFIVKYDANGVVQWAVSP